MAYADKDDIKDLLLESRKQARIWREDYEQFERLMDNGLMEGLDPNLPEVNDGSLSAALFKLPKRVYDDSITGTVSVQAIDADEDDEKSKGKPTEMPKWLPILANMEWQNHIIPNANTQAPFDWKWKAAIRKAAGYGSVPIITLSVHRDGKNYTDFIVGQPQDVVLEEGKVSDYDSDVEFWDVYFSRLQFKSMIQQAQEEMGLAVTDPDKDAESDESETTTTDEATDKDSADNSNSSNHWDIPGMLKIYAGDFEQEREGPDVPRAQKINGQKPKGFKFTIVVQRGVDAPFYMYHEPTASNIREWDNPDPTGDSCIHFLYCYQDLINPYGIGICKLAGGTQNVLDYMRQADILATQLGLRPPINIQGDPDQVDFDSLIYAQDAPWITGNAKVQRMEMSNAVYTQLPNRMAMYQSSLQKLIPTGDTSASSTDSGDPTQSKTPAGVKLAAANLSIDDEEFKDNFLATYTAVANSMLNTHFANMEGKDMRTVTDDERDQLIKAGMPWPKAADGSMSNQLEIDWDTVRGKFKFTVDPKQDKMQEDADKLQGLQAVLQLVENPETQALLANPKPIIIGNKKLDVGELIGDIITLSSDNDKIVTDVTPQDEEIIQQQAQAQSQQDQQQPKTLGEAVTWTPGDLTDNERAQALAQVGITADTQPVTPNEVQQQQSNQMDMQKTANDAHSKAHAQLMAEANHVQQNQQHEDAIQQQAVQNQEQPANPVAKKKPANQPKPTTDDATVQSNVRAVMEHYGVDQPTALKALAAEHAGLPVEDIIGKLQEGQQ